MADTSVHTPDLARRWSDLRRERPRTRIRDAASALGVTELELLETGLGDGVVRLRPEFRELLESFPALGPVMVLTRNEACVLETEGTFDGIRIFEHAAQVVAPGVDLRIFPTHWRHVYAVEQEAKGGRRRSVQVFDRDGTAVFKVFLREESDEAAYRDLIGRLRHADQGSPVRPEPAPELGPARPDDEIDRAGLLDGWEALADTHEFFRLLRRYGATRTQALRLAEGRFTRPVSRDAGRAVLEAVSRDAIPIMVFVGSPGTVQIHTGLVKRVFEHEQWLNVMDPGANLHLRQDLVHEAWVVRKPTDHGAAVSVELYDVAGGQIASFFALRKPGGDGGAAWEAMVEGLDSPRVGR